MKEYKVRVKFSGIVDIAIEAETEDEAVKWAEENFYSEASIEDSCIDGAYITSERGID